MQTSWTGLLSAAALAVLTACGGGGTHLESSGAAPALQPAGIAPARDTGPIRASAGAGAIQTGSGSASRIGAEVDPLVISRLSAELDQIEQALRRVDDGEVEKHEAIEVVKDTRAELEKERPNRLKLRGLVGGLAQGVQGLGGLKGAGRLLTQLVTMV